MSQNQPKNVSFTKNSPTNFHGKLRKMIKTMKISIFKKLEKSQMMKLFLVIFNHRACFSKGINVLKPTFWTIANICPRLSPFSRRLQYLFFGFRKRDNTSKKTWKSPLLDCLSLKTKTFFLPLSSSFCWLFSCQNKRIDDDDKDYASYASIFPIE